MPTDMITVAMHCSTEVQKVHPPQHLFHPLQQKLLETGLDPLISMQQKHKHTVRVAFT